MGTWTVRKGKDEQGECWEVWHCFLGQRSRHSTWDTRDEAKAERDRLEAQEAAEHAARWRGTKP